MKNIAIFGATGSVGSQALEVIEHSNNDPEQPDYNVVVVAAYDERELLDKVAKKFDSDSVLFSEVGREGLIQIAKREDVDIVIMAVTGIESIYPTIEALKLGKRVLLATKEALVVGGREIMEAAKKGELLSIDSEHSAIFQALKGEKSENIRRVLLTCSGGPFLGLTKEQLEKRRIEDAMTHPVWGMGLMNTVNSATLMNKAFEVIEAHYLFDLPYDKIKIVVHKEALNHGTVEFIDGFTISVYSAPTMKKPIAHALAYPERIRFKEDNISLMEPTSYIDPDYDTFILARIGINAGKTGGSAPVALHAINSVVVEGAAKFPKARVLWIQETVETIFSKYEVKHNLNLAETIEEHKLVEETTIEYIKLHPPTQN